MLAVQLQPLEALLCPLPILLLLLLGQHDDLGVFLRIALEYAWADQVSGIAYGTALHRAIVATDNQDRPVPAGAGQTRAALSARTPQQSDKAYQRKYAQRCREAYGLQRPAYRSWHTRYDLHRPQ